MPNLLDIQLESYEEFLQQKVAPVERESKGLQAVFETVFPIEDSQGHYKLEFINYIVGSPKYSIEECHDRGMTYNIPLKASLRLSIAEEDNKDEVAEVIEQDVFFGNIPFMTDRGTFIINGSERVIVSQLHRSPGVFFDQSIHPNGTKLYSARIIPFRGSWVDFTTDINDALFALIDRRKKFPVTTLLRAIGYSSNTDILELFGMAEEVKLSSRTISKYYEKALAENVVNKETGEILAEAGTKLDKELVAAMKKEGIKSVGLVVPTDEKDADVISNTLAKDASHDEESALRLIYKQLRSGEPPNLETARKFVDRLFFSPAKYDLGIVGRYRINRRFNLSTPDDTTVLTREDIVAIIKHLLEVKKGNETTDDIDHLGNRRIKTMGEQLSNQFSIAFARTARTIKERMNVSDAETLTPSELINSRIITSVINTFFGTSQLSQFMDQTNPLAELTHKRRLSALGPGGLTRERAGFEVRDIHYTHYGRLCPIETPEGPNIGLISSLCTFARINTLGFIESPYREVSHNGKTRVTNKIEFLSADEEERSMIAQANAALDDKGHFSEQTTQVRMKGDFPIVDVKDVDYMDVAPHQIVSAAAALIPFLEHDDANRALMGSNMQRQAVPLLKPSTPIVGTGMERIVALDSKALLLSDVDGVVESATGDKITVRKNSAKIGALDQLLDEGIREYKLIKYLRTNQDTCVNQKPLVKVGDKVNQGDILADGSATDRGELALGQNILVAFMPWRGYNYEDAIVVSARLARDDVFTSLHIEEYEMQVRDTKRGEEELTREIPNVSEEATRNLDEDGVIRIGAEVEPGDILIGKVTPKGETDPTPEEKLLKAIFGEKAGDVKDASLKASPGVYGVVVDTKMFTRRSKDFRQEEKQQTGKMRGRFRRRLNWLKSLRNEKMLKILEGKKSSGLRDGETGKSVLKMGLELTAERIAEIEFDALSREKPWTDNSKANALAFSLMDNYEARVQEIDEEWEKEKFKMKAGEDLPPGIIQLVKVYIASKRKISVGDKMAGRHGNKGVVAEIVPIEDMPFLADGTPIDLVLNPLGVPSRMNLGQIYETLLGYAGYKLGVHYETPVFDGARVEEVLEELKKAGIAEDGKTELYDGITGEKFHQRVTVGKIYMMKLSHLVDDKMHARSTGPYSLITQQPLGGKAQFGGQRFGEMEVWALEAYGAAYTLQEMLTVKSDDVDGRSKVYEALVKGQNLPDSGIPESFNVLLRELMGLGIDVELK
ncbi:MAG: DNA-directed RNA polymerase subunit beta [Candidatus Marinimicrobia bacterium]|nr:DNA-directed RNA polymerase subunit beta [Candidatus Neomarinimicrobiota bacterium]